MPHCKKIMLSFFITTKCNLCCRYCYNAQERAMISEQTLLLDIAKAGIDWYFANNESRHIRFYGPGEPTMELELLRDVTDYARQHKNDGERVTTEIQTNGVWLEDVRAWILDNLNIVWLSFDGMRDIQDYNRPLNKKYNVLYGNRKSAEILENNAKWLVANKGNRDIMVGARVTITDSNILQQTQMVDYFDSLGIHYIWTDPLFPSVRNKPVCYNLTKPDVANFDYDTYIREYLKAYTYAREKGIFYGSFLAVNFDGECEYHCRACTPLAAPHITTDGYLSACDMVLSGNEPAHMRKFIFGKWNFENEAFEFFDDKISALKNRKYKNILHCKNCKVNSYCGGYCLGEVVNETGKLNGQLRNKCAAIIKLYERMGEQSQYKYLHP